MSHEVNRQSRCLSPCSASDLPSLDLARQQGGTRGAALHLLDYVFVDDEGNLIGGSYVRPNDPSGDRPIWVRLDPESSTGSAIDWVHRQGAYAQVVMPLNRAPVYVSGLSARSPGGGHALVRRKRLSKAAPSPRRLRARGISPSSARSSTCPDGHYWSWSKKRCVKSKF